MNSYPMQGMNALQDPIRPSPQMNHGGMQDMQNMQQQNQGLLEDPNNLDMCLAG